MSAKSPIVELIENGIEADKRKRPEFFELAGRYRSTGADGVRRLKPKIETWDNLPAAVLQHLIDRSASRISIAAAPGKSYQIILRAVPPVGHASAEPPRKARVE